MADYDLVARNGTVATASDVFRADIGVGDGRIATIGRARLSAELDASGLPGVVDMGRVRTLVDEHFGGAANHSYRLWQLAYFGFWLQAVRTAPAHRVY